MLLRLITLVLISGALSLASASTPEFKKLYDEVLNKHFSAKSKPEFAEIAKQFQDLAERKDGGVLKSNAHYWAGESYYASGNFVLALAEFDQVLLMPLSNKEEDARLKIALCYLRLRWQNQAKWEFERFMRDFPASAHISRVKEELNKFNTAN